MKGTQGKRSLPGIAFLDYLSNLLLLFVCLFAMAFALIVVKTKPARPSIDPLGYYVVVVTWRTGSHDDVDTYVEDPHKNIVYFANPQVGLMHLEQDDLGTGISNTDGTQVLKQNQERVVLQGVEQGEYIVNVHLYTKRDPGPIKVTIKLYRLHGPDKILIESQVVLQRQGDQKTAFRFTLNKSGQYTGSNRLFKNVVYQTLTDNSGTTPDAPPSNYPSTPSYPFH